MRGSKSFGKRRAISNALEIIRCRLNLFGKSSRGNLSIMTAILLPVVMLVVGVAVDYSTIHLSVSKLQDAADSSAIASAREMVLPGADTAAIQAVAVNYVQAHLGSTPGFLAPPTIVATADKTNGTLEISITALKKNAFGGFLQPETSTLKVNAVARSYGGGKTCIIILEPKAGQAVELRDGSHLIAQKCTVHSNSIDSAGIKLQSGTHMVASKICSSGGVKFDGGSTNIKPITDCPVIDDPLAYKIPPPVGSCDHVKMVIKDTEVITIDPGVYCGGLTIKEFAQVTLRPGVYVMKDGPLIVTGEASMIGNYVGFYFLGDGSEMLFKEETTIELKAPKDGPMAGFLMFSDRSNQKLQPFIISSSRAKVLLGTIYLPNGSLTINSSGVVANKSAYTVIVARQLMTEGNPKIIIRSNYNSTDVPVPDGVGPSADQVVLVK